MSYKNLCASNTLPAEEVLIFRKFLQAGYESIQISASSLENSINASVLNHYVADRNSLVNRNVITSNNNSDYCLDTRRWNIKSIGTFASCAGVEDCVKHTEDEDSFYELEYIASLEMGVAGEEAKVVNVVNKYAVNILPTDVNEIEFQPLNQEPTDVNEIEFQPLNQDLVILSSYGIYNPVEKIELMQSSPT